MINQKVNSVSSFEDFQKYGATAKYFILTESSFTYDDGYGSHGQTSTSTHRQLDILAAQDEDGLKEWIRANAETKYGSPKTFKVVEVRPVTIKTVVEVQVG
jgi:hypothetical protein